MVSAVLGPRRRALALCISRFTALIGAVAVFLLFRAILFSVVLGMFAWRSHWELGNFR